MQRWRREWLLWSSTVFSLCPCLFIFSPLLHLWYLNEFTGFLWNQEAAHPGKHYERLFFPTMQEFLKKISMRHKDGHHLLQQLETWFKNSSDQQEEFTSPVRFGSGASFGTSMMWRFKTSKRYCPKNHHPVFPSQQTQQSLFLFQCTLTYVLADTN